MTPPSNYGTSEIKIVQPRSKDITNRSTLYQLALMVNSYLVDPKIVPLDYGISEWANAQFIPQMNITDLLSRSNSIMKIVCSLLAVQIKLQNISDANKNVMDMLAQPI